jgi:hypothetical protein
VTPITVSGTVVADRSSTAGFRLIRRRRILKTFPAVTLSRRILVNRGNSLVSNPLSCHSLAVCES